MFESDNARFTILIVLSAMAAGATGVLAPLKQTGRIYITLMLIPASVTLIAESSPQSPLGYVGVVFWLVMLVGHNTNYGLITQSLELGRHNADLILELKARNDEILGMNLSMERRVAERIAELQGYAIEAQAESRQKAERLDAVRTSVASSAEHLRRLARILGEANPGSTAPEPSVALDLAAQSILDAAAA